MKVIQILKLRSFFISLNSIVLLLGILALLSCNNKTKNINTKVKTYNNDTIDLKNKYDRAMIVIADGNVACSQCFKSLCKVRDLIKSKAKFNFPLVCVVVDSHSAIVNRKTENSIRQLLNQDTTYLDFVVNKEDNIGQIANTLGTEYYPELIVLIDGRIIHYDYKFLFETLDGQSELIIKKIIEDIGI